MKLTAEELSIIGIALKWRIIDGKDKLGMDMSRETKLKTKIENELRRLINSGA